MHVVVTGASGFVGRVLIDALAATGSTGVAVARRPISGLPAGWKHGPREERLSAPIAGADAVIHLEARHHQYVIGEGSPAQAAEFIRTNLGNTQAWLDWSTRSGTTRFVFFSSVKALDLALAAQAGMVDETTPGPGPTLYGRSKWQAERAVAAWAATAGRCALILRPAVIYGPGNTGNIYSMVAAIAQRRFVFVGRNDNIKSLVSVQNATAATVHLLARMRPGSEIYHLVDGGRYSVRELACMIARELGVPAPRLGIPVGLARAAAWVADVLARATGISLPITRARLNALCEHADCSPAKLLRTGFVYPETPEESLAAMVAWCRTAMPGRGPGAS